MTGIHAFRLHLLAFLRRLFHRVPPKSLPNAMVCATVYVPELGQRLPLVVRFDQGIRSKKSKGGGYIFTMADGTTRALTAQEIAQRQAQALAAWRERERAKSGQVNI